MLFSVLASIGQEEDGAAQRPGKKTKTEVDGVPCHRARIVATRSSVRCVRVGAGRDDGDGPVGRRNFRLLGVAVAAAAISFGGGARFSAREPSLLCVRAALV